jgi:hypothetical protein
MIHLLILRYHATDQDLRMPVNMVEDSLKHLTTNIVKINIDSIREVPVTLRYIIMGPSQLVVNLDFTRNVAPMSCLNPRRFKPLDIMVMTTKSKAFTT